MVKRIRCKKRTQTERSNEDGSGPDANDNPGTDIQWLDTTLKGKERSRIQRQMRARRELERRLDEKNLRALIDDEWLIDSAN